MHLQFHHVRFSRGVDDYVISAEATQLLTSAINILQKNHFHRVDSKKERPQCRPSVSTVCFLRMKHKNSLVAALDLLQLVAASSNLSAIILQSSNLNTFPFGASDHRPDDCPPWYSIQRQIR
jgi:hypothetical protein